MPDRELTHAHRADLVDAGIRPAKAASIGAPESEGSADALTAFLREVGRLPSLTRAEEVEAARLIESGEQEILDAVLSTATGRRELAALGAKLRNGGLPLRALISDYSNKNLDPARRREQLLTILESLEGRRTSAALKEANLAREPVRSIAVRIKAMSPHASRGSSRSARGGRRPIGLRGMQLDEIHRAIANGERKAREGRARLVESHLWLVHFIARKYRGRGLPLLDLVQEGAIVGD